MTRIELRKSHAGPHKEVGYVSGLAVEETTSHPTPPGPPGLEAGKVPVHCPNLEVTQLSFFHLLTEKKSDRASKFHRILQKEYIGYILRPRERSKRGFAIFGRAAEGQGTTSRKWDGSDSGGARWDWSPGLSMEPKLFRDQGWRAPLEDPSHR